MPASRKPDAQALTKYPLRTVVDFRTDLEREQKPDRVLPGVQYVHCPIVQQAAAGLTREARRPLCGRRRAREAMAGRERAFMCELYRSLVTQAFSIAHYRQFFALLLAQTDGALLYHCTAGKDRVGVGTMLLLTALGVDWPVIVENYLITNERMAASTDCLLTAVVDYDLKRGGAGGHPHV
ncbi:MAG: tyrosine-protein phosphatase [Oscillospiraceae bacterium]